jgi:hypothetical protein
VSIPYTKPGATGRRAELSHIHTIFNLINTDSDLLMTPNSRGPAIATSRNSDSLTEVSRGVAVGGRGLNEFLSQKRSKCRFKPKTV